LKNRPSDNETMLGSAVVADDDLVLGGSCLTFATATG
jgi:hypothetical protein